MLLSKKQASQAMLILGIDPGTAETGFGVISCGRGEIKLIEHGMIKTSKDFDSAKRLNLIYKQTLEILRKHKPQVLAMESLFFNLNAKSASAVGQAIGVIKLAAARRRVKTFEYPPLRIKMVLAGNGRAEKRQIQSEVRKILKLRRLPRPTHAADALAVAICHWQTTKKR
jgi:crossover junction endodeoxyribonuclease RuvC